MDFAHWWRAVLHLPRHHTKVKYVDAAVPRALSVKAVDEDFVATSVRDSSSWSAGEYVRNAPVSLFMLILQTKNRILACQCLSLQLRMDGRFPCVPIIYAGHWIIKHRNLLPNLWIWWVKLLSLWTSLADHETSAKSAKPNCQECRKL